MIINNDDDLSDITYTHSIDNASCGHNIDLNTTININILEYLIGGIKKIKYVDNTYIDINIEPFSLNDIIVKGKGLLGGNLNVQFIYINITLKDWKKISKKKRGTIINIMKNIYSDNI